MLPVTSLICINPNKMSCNILRTSRGARDDGGFCCKTQTEAAKQPALEILKERFARGEIAKAEFEERRQVLSNATQETPAAAVNKGRAAVDRGALSPGEVHRSSIGRLSMAGLSKAALSR